VKPNNGVSCPLYVFVGAFKHNQNSSGFYATFYQYFLSRWNDPEIPEYDFDTEELVYRNETGNEDLLLSTT